MNCKYNVSSLKPVFYLVDDDSIIYGDYDIALENAERHDCLSVSFSGQSALDGRYSFNKGITIVLEGYQPDLELVGKRIAVETRDGDVFLVNFEFQALPIYSFSEWNTTYNIELPENLPILPCTLVSPSGGTTYHPCEYSLSEAREITLVKHDCSSYASGTIHLYDTEPITFDNVRNLELVEQYDGYIYSQTIQLTLPLDADTDVETYKLQEFQQNQYIAIVGNRFVCGIDLGLDVQTTITSDNENGSITLELRSDENFNMVEEESGITIDDSDHIEWRYQLKTPDGLYCWVCDGLEPNPTGNAQYILQCGYYPNGVFANKYREQREFQGWYPQIQDQVVGTFSDVVTFYKDSCYMPDTLKIDGITSPLKFNIVGQRRNIEIKSTWSNWTATTVPSFVTLSQERGTSGSTTITMTCTGNTNEQGTLMIANAHNAQSFTIIADFSDAVIVQSTEIDYRAKTLTYWLRRPVYLYRKSSTSGFDAAVAISGKWVKITYCENQTGQDVVYTFVFGETMQIVFYLFKFLISNIFI